MKLVPKMTGILALSASTVLVGYGYLTVNREQEMLRESVVSDARLVAKVMRRSFLQEHEAEGRDAAFKLLEHASASEDKVKFSVLSIGAELAAALDLRPAQLDLLRQGREVLAIQTDPPVLALLLPVSLPKDPHLVLVLQESIQREREYVANTRRYIASATLSLVLLMGVIAFVVGSRVVGRPLQLLTAKARRVGQGDLSVPLELQQADELGELAQTMNQMCDDLSSETQRRMQTLEQLRHAERLATVGRLASGLAHELGTPLNVVLGRAIMNTADGCSADQTQENAKIIVEQTERMSGIIRQLLDFARRGAAETAPHDLRALGEHLQLLLEPLANEAHVQLTLSCAPEETVARVDQNQIEQALTNLVVNAIQASAEGGEVRLRIDVRSARPPDGELSAPHVCVAVEDDGPGIPPDVRSRLFEPFFTTKDVGQGTGLGLPVAHGIVSDHSGWIEVESDGERGSRFSVYLPVAGGSAA